MGTWSPTSSEALAELGEDGLTELWLTDLPVHRSEAPEVWDQAVQMLSAATLEAARSTGRVVVTQEQLLSLLELHGAPPECMPVVFDHLIRTGALQTSLLLPGDTSPFGNAARLGAPAAPSDAAPSGLGWAVNVFWTSLGYASTASPPPTVTPTTPLVLPVAVDAAADAVAAALAAPSRIEAVTDLAAVAQAACGGDLQSAAVVADRLAATGRAALQPDVLPMAPGRGIKFCDVDEGFTSVDVSVLSLKAATARLDALDSTLTDAAASARKSAKSALASGNVPLAKRYLRREADLRRRLDLNAGAGSNLAAALAAVDTADGNRETVAALAAGNAALKELSGPSAASVADVDALAVEFGELTEGVEDVSTALAQASGPSAAVDADAEAELEEMEQALEAERAAATAAAADKVAADKAAAAARARRAAAAAAAAAADADADAAAAKLAAAATSGVGTTAAAATAGGRSGEAASAATGGDVDDLLADLDNLHVSSSPPPAAREGAEEQREGRVRVPA
ncbi:hypothetical protein BU14_0527s0005 [Porphyra umbilicalis]|uniref:Charged multivesicular body protein 7 n=1 Tax=Porphyra umbilicalis TaxID=2786 RepID=A0A1X6NSB4_PORUM|nr:hypothetical protein BU14_0527s0005 [Porphyra umbilicalis]|eukprot:OSX71492.1 hypothetical protein BU14_0527s0005 [Porphyra umbilicalis]